MIIFLGSILCLYLLTSEGPSRKYVRSNLPVFIHLPPPPPPLVHSHNMKNVQFYGENGENCITDGHKKVQNQENDPSYN